VGELATTFVNGTLALHRPPSLALAIGVAPNGSEAVPSATSTAINRFISPPSPGSVTSITSPAKGGTTRKRLLSLLASLSGTRCSLGYEVAKWRPVKFKNRFLAR
jgi:hypothetical protein